MELRGSAMVVALFSGGILASFAMVPSQGGAPRVTAVGGADAGSRLGDLMDLERYPIDDLGGVAGVELVTRAREDLERTGCASFPSFLTASALENAVGEAARKAPVAYRTGWPTEQRVLRCPFSP